MSIKKIFFSCCFIFISTLQAQSQFDVGHYEKKDSKAYFVSELGMGIGYIRNTHSEGTVANPLGFSTGEYVYNVYTNQGVMFNVNPKWSIGFHGNIGLNIGDISQGSWLGLRTRVSHHFKHDIEWNISPGIRATHIGEINGYDIESTVTWKDHIGVYLRYEREKTNSFDFYDKTEIYSVGLFTKGKKGFWSAFGTTMGAMAFTAFLVSVLGGN